MVLDGYACSAAVGEQVSTPPPFVKDKRGGPAMTPHLVTLVKRVAKLHEAGLKACHCAEEFTLW
jgi:hypothetical protein